MQQEMDRSPFIAHLERLRDSDDRKALAILRRGLNDSPRARLEMYPYVIMFLRNEASKWEEDVLFTIASLFSSHPSPGGVGDMGTVLSEVRRRTGSDSIEGRFLALLRAPSENVLDHLKQSISLAKSNEVSIEWDRLYRDLLWWNSEKMNIQKKWASSFWGSSEENSV